MAVYFQKTFSWATLSRQICVWDGRYVFVNAALCAPCLDIVKKPCYLMKWIYFFYSFVDLITIRRSILLLPFRMNSRTEIVYIGMYSFDSVLNVGRVTFFHERQIIFFVDRLSCTFWWNNANNISYLNYIFVKIKNNCWQPWKKL